MPILSLSKASEFKKLNSRQAAHSGREFRYHYRARSCPCRSLAAHLIRKACVHVGPAGTHARLAGNRRNRCTLRLQQLGSQVHTELPENSFGDHMFVACNQPDMIRAMWCSSEKLCFPPSGLTAAPWQRGRPARALFRLNRRTYRCRTEASAYVNANHS